MAEPTISTDIERKKYLLERFASKEITLDEFIELACWPRTKIKDDVRDSKGKKRKQDKSYRNSGHKSNGRSDGP